MQDYRSTLALLAGAVIVLPTISALAWLIHTRDWGIGLMFLVPFVVYGAMRLARALETWASRSRTWEGQ